MKKAKWWILALCMMVFVSSVPFEAVYASSKVDEGILSEETENEGSNQENDLNGNGGENSDQNIDKDVHSCHFYST